MFNLKEIISSIADVGQKLFKKSVVKKNDLESIISLCDDLISNKGAAFGIFILLGVIAGTFLAVSLKTPTLVLFFSIFAFMVGLFFIFVREKLMDNPKKISDLVKNISGVIIGFISIPLGIGGGSLMVPFMRTFGYDIRKSIGTAAAVGFLIAVTLSLIHI